MRLVVANLHLFRPGAIAAAPGIKILVQKLRAIAWRRRPPRSRGRGGAICGDFRHCERRGAGWLLSPIRDRSHVDGRLFNDLFNAVFNQLLGRLLGRGG